MESILETAESISATGSHAELQQRSHRRGYCGISVGLVAFVAVSSVVQILGACLTTFGMDLNMVRSSRVELDGLISTVETDFRNIFVTQTIGSALVKTHTELRDMSECADMLFHDIGGKRLHPYGEGAMLARTLHSFLLYFDVRKTYITTGEGHYIGTRRVDAGSKEIMPDFFFESTIPWGTQFPDRNADVLYRDLKRYSMDGGGTPDPESEQDLIEFFSPRSAQAYDQAINSGEHALFTEAYMEEESQEPGIDACVVYDVDTSVYGVTPVGDKDSERVVSCCHRSLESVSKALQELRLSPGGVAFIVEMSTGLLVAATAANTTLRVTATTPSSATQQLIRVKATEYPQDLNPLVSKISHNILAKYRTYDNVTDKESSFFEVQIGNQREGWFAAGALNELPEWIKIKQHKRFAGRDWLLVLGGFVDTIDSPALDSSKWFDGPRQTLMMRELLLMCLSVFVVAPLCVLATRHVRFRLQQLKIHVQALQYLDFSGSNKVLRQKMPSKIWEISKIINTFLRMKNYLEVFAKFIPSTVVRLTNSDNMSDNSSAWNRHVHVGQLQLEEKECVILVTKIRNYEMISSELSQVELLALTNLYVSSLEGIARRHNGVLADWKADIVVVFWVGYSCRESASRAAQDACHAVGNIRWEHLCQSDVAGRTQPSISCSGGLCSGMVHIGAYGTEVRMKIGPMGEVYETALRLAGLAITHEVVGVATQETAKSAPRLYSSSSLGSIERPGIGKTTDFFQLHPCVNAPEEVEMENEMESDAGDEQDDGRMQDPAPDDPTLGESVSVRGRRVESVRCQEMFCQISTPYLKSGILWLVVVSSFQIFLVLGLLSVITSSVRDDLSSSLRSGLNSVVVESTTNIITQAIRVQLAIMTQYIWRLPVCSEMFANDIRMGKFNWDDNVQAARGLRTFSKLFDYTVFAADRDNRYFVSVDTSNDPRSVTPFGFGLQSQVSYNQFPYNLSAYSNMMIMVDVNMQTGDPLPGQPYRIYVPNWVPRQRPAYLESRDAGVPFLREPYWLTGYNALGYEVCTPIYDGSSLPKQNLEVDPMTEMGSWNESMISNACCSSYNDDLPDFLAQMDVGANGVSFVVQAGGTKVGALIGAAARNRTLPTIAIPRGTIAIEFTQGDELTFLYAESYPKALHSKIQTVSRLLLRDFGRWDSVVDRVQMYHESEVDALSESPTNSSQTDEIRLVAVQTLVLEGVVPGWHVREGKWSADEFQVDQMKWVVVIAMDTTDFIQTKDIIEANEKMLQENASTQTLVVWFLCVLAIIVPVAFGLVMRSNLMGLEQQMNQLRQLNFHSPQISQSWIAEVAELQIEFENLQHTMSKMSKYVSKDIVEWLVGAKSEDIARAGRPGMVDCKCTVLCLNMTNFAYLASILTTKELVTLLRQYFECTSDVIARFDGVLDDFSSDRVTAFWLHDEKDDTGVPCLNACLAAESLMNSIENLAMGWENMTKGLSVVISANVGLHTGKGMVGNCGSASQIKYGVVGSTVQIAAKTAGLARNISSTTGIVMMEQVYNEVRWFFICKHVKDSEHGRIWELCDRTQCGKSSKSDKAVQMPTSEGTKKQWDNLTRATTNGSATSAGKKSIRGLLLSSKPEEGTTFSDHVSVNSVPTGASSPIVTSNKAESVEVSQEPPQIRQVSSGEAASMRDKMENKMRFQV